MYAAKKYSTSSKPVKMQTWTGGKEKAHNISLSQNIRLKFVELLPAIEFTKSFSVHISFTFETNQNRKRRTKNVNGKKNEITEI